MENRPAAELPPEPRPTAEIHRSLLDQARKAVEKDVGGADPATKDELIRRMGEIEAMGASGIGFAHPGMLQSLAEFSSYLDTYDADAFKRDMAGYFGARLKELAELPEDADVAGLRAKWWRELARDDSPEAILLRRVAGSNTKAQMERMLADLAR